MSDLSSIEGTPILVSGMENSGTRVAVWYLQSLGIDMGEPLYPEMSWVPFDGFVRKYLYQYYGGNIEKLPSILESRIYEHSRNSEPWGFKSARAIYMIEFFLEVIPKLKFIHVIRDGRDISDKFIDIAIQDGFEIGVIHKEERKLFSNKYDLYLYFWGIINRIAKKLFLQYPDRYLLLKLEDMVSPKEKGRIMGEIINFTGVKVDDMKGKDYDVFYRLDRKSVV